MPMRRISKRERGAALVEFAFVVPLLAMFLFGIVQFGLAYDKKQSINSAAREGARAAAIPITTVDDVESVVDGSFQALTPATITTVVKVDGTTFAAGSTTQKPCAGNEGKTVVVTATVTHQWTIPFIRMDPSTITGEGEFRCERA